MKNPNELKKRKEKLEENKSVNTLLNIKSKVILRKIINNLSKKKSLEVLHYNYKIQKLLDISLEDYKNYCQKYSSIEIEIALAKNINGRFINIDKNFKPYFHIYSNKFNNAGKIKIVIDYQVNSFFCLFQYCSCIESINFIKCHRNNIYDMSYMFDYCQSLKEIKFSSFNTDNVKNMSNMFKEC